MTLTDNVRPAHTWPSILVVDDEPNFLELLKMVLSKEGYKVTTACAGVDALIEVDTRRFSVAILDIRMHP